MGTIDEIIAENDIRVHPVAESEGLRTVALSSTHHSAPLEVLVPADVGATAGDIIRTLTLQTWEVLTAMSFEDWANDQDRDPADPHIRGHYARISGNADAVYLIYGGKEAFEAQAMSL